ncbi:hypothetical protein MAR_033073 [Mya arenaria]|uniref:Uncharacterized protein n=1 Tax=Mya arenaria TaxID=6604 RepID=A0ABY7GBP8_MYAAR|nr:hypothetical protein MAR_033073 [Mya arenaria]
MIHETRLEREARFRVPSFLWVYGNHVFLISLYLCNYASGPLVGAFGLEIGLWKLLACVSAPLSISRLAIMLNLLLTQMYNVGQMDMQRPGMAPHTTSAQDEESNCLMALATDDDVSLCTTVRPPQSRKPLRKNLSVFLYVPNIIDYFRLLFLGIFCHQAFAGDHVVAAGSYVISVALDELDGNFARWLNQMSLFGHVVSLWPTLAYLAAPFSISRLVIMIALLVTQMYHLGRLDQEKAARVAKQRGDVSWVGKQQNEDAQVAKQRGEAAWIGKQHDTDLVEESKNDPGADGEH